MTDLGNASLYEDDDDEPSASSHDEEGTDIDDDVKSDRGGRKFFKSSSNRRIKREYKLVNNMTATVHKGSKITLKSSKPRKRKHTSLFEDGECS